MQKQRQKFLLSAMKIKGDMAPALRSSVIFLSGRTVQRLMNPVGAGLRAEKDCSYRGEMGKGAPNLPDRDFHAERPSQK